MEKPNNKPFIITILVLIIIILGLGGYIALDKFVFNKEEINQKTIVNDVNININVFYDVARILDEFDAAFNNPTSSYFGYIYNTKKLEVQKFDLGAAIFLTINDEIIKNNSLQYIKESVVKTKLEKDFGKSIKYEPVQITSNDYYKINYDGNNSAYAYIASIPTVNNKNGYTAVNINTKLTEDYIIVTRKIFYVEYTENSALIYKDASKKQKIGEISMKKGVLSTEEIIGKYGSKLNTYDYYFIQNTDTNYSFYKIVKSK